jgi:peptidoglycan LD-endopeptidase LytH
VNIDTFPFPKIIAILLVAQLLYPTLALPDVETAPAQTRKTSTPCPPCEAFNRLNSLIRDGRIPRAAAKRELVPLLDAVRAYYTANGGREYGEGEWVFPLKGYDSRAIGGGRRHGYAAGGYDFFDGNRHGGHPSFDIFIHDRDQDCRDDRSGNHVPVLSLTGGVVVAAEPEWLPGSDLRGGKYLWIFDPASDSLVYYAHNRELNVTVGQMVRPGDLLAHVGRTGLNASKRRSPTHLHLTLLRVRNGSPRPTDIYRPLTRARTIR